MQIQLQIGLGLCQALINYWDFFPQVFMPSHDLPMLFKGNGWLTIYLKYNYMLFYIYINANVIRYLFFSLFQSFCIQHIEELLRQQQFLEIFLEGTRSRSGKTSGPRAGLLSVVVDALFSNATPDVLIIPVGISYDRIIEGHYNSEQLVRAIKQLVLPGGFSAYVQENVLHS